MASDPVGEFLSNLFSSGVAQTNSAGQVAPRQAVTSNLVDPHGILGDPGTLANDALRLRGIGSEINNFAGYQDLAGKFRDNASRVQATNPYDTGVADQSRAGQLALMDQMRGMQSGPSVANMQGQRAFAQNGQQALMQGGRAGMLGAQNVGAGLAGDLGQARLAEMMRSNAGIGSAAGNLRSGDLASANAQMGAGFGAQNINDQRAQFYASQGARLDQARAQAASDDERLRQQVALGIAGKQLNIGTGMLGAGATALSTAAGMGKK
jgi:hypothetical protein